MYNGIACSSSIDARGKTLVCESAQHLEWWARWMTALLTRRCSLASEVRARAFFKGLSFVCPVLVTNK
jgi:hypothetical protein